MLRWAVQNKISVIPKTTKEDRMKENLDIFDFELKPEHMEMLDNMNEDKSAYQHDPKPYNIK